MSEQSIFTEALEISDPVERAAFLDRACAGDPELRQRIERLLDRHERVGGFLEEPANLPPAPDSRSPSDPAPNSTQQAPLDMAGGAIGPYRILEAIGEGGMGSVYLAQQHVPVRRQVALKVVKAGMDTEQVIARFEAERQALALMDHPNIARVLDAGATPAGRPYFVMELVKGVPITKFCDQRRLTTRERLELLVPVCQAVQHAHQKGIIHRDLKPSNVLVAVYDGRPVPKVIDFGIAKAAGQPLTEKTLVTWSGTVVGTLEYMSPEQAGLHNQDLDTRTDVYALGVLLYELLTGTTPVERNQFKEAALFEVLRMIREEEPPRPSTRLSTSNALARAAAARQIEPTRLVSLVRGDLDWIVMKALEKNRDRRYETANGLAMDLIRFLNDEAVHARPPTASYRLRKFVRKNRGAVLAAGLFVGALAAGVVGTTIGLIRANRAERLARHRLADVTEQRNRADAAAAETRAINNFLTEDLLGQADPDRNSPNQKLTVEELLRRAEKRIDRNKQFTALPGIEATLDLTIARTYAKLGLLPEAERHYRRALVLRRDGLGPEHPDTLAAQEALADFLNLFVVEPQESEPLAKQTWQARARVLGPDNRDTLDSLDTYATALYSAGRPREALELSLRCLEARKRALGADDPQTLMSLNNVGVILRELGEYDKAIPYFSEILSQPSKRTVAPSDVVNTAYNLADTYYLQGNLAEADRILTERTDWSLKTVGENNPSVDRLLGLAVPVWAELGRLDQAVARGESVLKARRKNYDAGHFLIGAVLLDLGRARGMQAKYEPALRDLDEALPILNRSPKAGPHWVHWAQCWRGACLTGLGRYAEAEPVLLEAERGLSATPTTPARFKQKVVEHLVRLYDQWRRPAEATEWRKKLPPGEA